MDNIVHVVTECDSITLEVLLNRGASPQALDDKGWSLLRRTALSGSHPCAILLLAHGASVEFGGEPDVSPLITAAASNQAEMVKLLLAHGANVDAYSGQAGLFCTALIAAALRGYTGVVSLLLSHGADMEKRCYRGKTALFCWKPQVIRLLLEHGADVTLLDDDGETALTSALWELNHEEFYEGMQEVVELLQEADRQGDAYSNWLGKSREP